MSHRMRSSRSQVLRIMVVVAEDAAAVAVQGQGQVQGRVLDLEQVHRGLRRQYRRTMMMVPLLVVVVAVVAVVTTLLVAVADMMDTMQRWQRLQHQHQQPPPPIWKPCALSCRLKWPASDSDSWTNCSAGRPTRCGRLWRR